MRVRAEFGEDGREGGVAGVLCTILRLNLTPELCCGSRAACFTSILGVYRTNGE